MRATLRGLPRILEEIRNIQEVVQNRDTVEQDTPQRHYEHAEEDQEAG